MDHTMSVEQARFLIGLLSALAALAFACGGWRELAEVRRARPYRRT